MLSYACYGGVPCVTELQRAETGPLPARLLPWWLRWLQSGRVVAGAKTGTTNCHSCTCQLVYQRAQCCLRVPAVSKLVVPGCLRKCILAACEEAHVRHRPTQPIGNRRVSEMPNHGAGSVVQEEANDLQLVPSLGDDRRR